MSKGVNRKIDRMNQSKGTQTQRTEAQPKGSEEEEDECWAGVVGPVRMVTVLQTERAEGGG